VPSDFLMEVSARCDLTGGQIRNAALLAALLAVGEDSQSVPESPPGRSHTAEYRKAGAVCPLDTAGISLRLLPNLTIFCI